MPGRVEIDDVAPVVSCGAYPAKAVVDEVVALDLALRTDIDARIMTAETDVIAIMAVGDMRTGETLSKTPLHSLQKTRGIAAPFSCSSLPHVFELAS